MRPQALILASLALLLTLSPAYSKDAVKSVITDSRSWSQTFDVNQDADLNLRCRESDVKVETWDKNVVEVNVTLTVEAYDQEELDKMLEMFEPNISGNSSGVNVQNPDCTSEESNGKRTKIRINNQIIKVKSYRYKIDIKMPESNHLNARTYKDG